MVINFKRCNILYIQFVSLNVLCVFKKISFVLYRLPFAFIIYISWFVLYSFQLYSIFFFICCVSLSFAFYKLNFYCIIFHVFGIYFSCIVQFFIYIVNWFFVLYDCFICNIFRDCLSWLVTKVMIILYQTG